MVDAMFHLYHDCPACKGQDHDRQVTLGEIELCEDCEARRDEERRKHVASAKKEAEVALLEELSTCTPKELKKRFREAAIGRLERRGRILAQALEDHFEGAIGDALEARIVDSDASGAEQVIKLFDAAAMQRNFPALARDGEHVLLPLESFSQSEIQTADYVITFTVSADVTLRKEAIQRAVQSIEGIRGERT